LAWKAYARQGEEFETYSIQKPPKSRRCEFLQLGFSDEDYGGVSLPHTDALVVTLAISNHKIHRILVDTGSSADILYKLAFKLMRIDRDKMTLTISPLVSFKGEQVLPINSIYSLSWLERS
jgi:hypothetical protein